MTPRNPEVNSVSPGDVAVDIDADSLIANTMRPVGTHAFIQWKGTDVCADVKCVCGRSVHIDGEFFYTYACLECGRTYVVNPYVEMFEVD